MPYKRYDPGRDAPAVFILSAVFVASAVCGTLCAAFGGLVGTEARSVADGAWRAPDVWLALLDTIKYPAVIFLMGFGSLGAVAIPLAFAAKGFFLSFSVTSCALLCDIRTAAALEVPANLFLLPCIFLLAVDGLQNSLSVFAMSTGVGKRFLRPRPGSDYYARAAVCAVLALASFAAETLLVPLLL